MGRVSTQRNSCVANPENPPMATNVSSKRTVCLTPDDEAKIAQIQQNFAPYEIKTHHILRMATRSGLAELAASTVKPATEAAK